MGKIKERVSPSTVSPLVLQLHSQFKVKQELGLLWLYISLSSCRSLSVGPVLFITCYPSSLKCNSKPWLQSRSWSCVTQHISFGWNFNQFLPLSPIHWHLRQPRENSHFPASLPKEGSTSICCSTNPPRPNPHQPKCSPATSTPHRTSFHKLNIANFLTKPKANYHCVHKEFMR